MNWGNLRGRVLSLFRPAPSTPQAPVRPRYPADARRLPRTFVPDPAPADDEDVALDDSTFQEEVHMSLATFEVHKYREEELREILMTLPDVDPLDPRFNEFIRTES
jgi:hypothetical protein